MLNHRDTNNRLLLSLADSDFERLMESARAVDFVGGEVLYKAETTLGMVWFPETGLISIMSVMLSGDMIETSVVGREGAVGFIEASGGGRVFSRAVIQLPGRFLCVPAATYRAAFADSASLRKVVQDHIELLVTEARQAMACIALHTVGQRLAWWLLEAQDRIGGSANLPLTQEFLAVMLAVRRPTVTGHARKLQAEGLISYARGRIAVLDRPGLERRACECYATTQHFRRIIEGRE